MRLIRSKSVGIGLMSLLSAAAIIAVPAAAQAQQTITGRVTTAGTNEPLGDTRVLVVNTSISTQSGADGRYTLRGVPTGTLEVRVLRVGFQEQKKSISVSAGSSASLDFVMTQAVIQLPDVVTTATGEQRRVELGNSITTLGDVGKTVENEQVKSLADLLVAKAPGVTVLVGNMTGQAPVVKLRGIGSLATAGSGISNNPIYVIDGVRMNTSNIGFGFTGTNGSLLNDIDPETIEDVEIVKGPSAATLYGTDAANGVIVITTKKGKAGTTRWSWYGEGASIDDRNSYPGVGLAAAGTYATWGHFADSPTLASRCTLITEVVPQTSGGVNHGVCIADSVTSFNALLNPTSSPIKLGHRDAYGAQMSGGSDQVRFFTSGDVANEMGPVTMPKFAQATLDTMGTQILDEWVHPEWFQNYGGRANLSAALSPKFDLTANAGFTNTNQRLPQVDNNTLSYIFSALNNPGFNHNSSGTTGLNYSEVGSIGEFKNGYGSFTPAQIMQFVTNNGTQRFIGSSDASWRPLAWMQNQGTIGVDFADNVETQTCLLSQCPNSGTLRQGSLSSTQTNLRNFSTKLVSNSTWQARQNLSMKSTIGADYTNLESDGTNSSGVNLPPGAQTIGAAATRVGGNTLQTVNKTLGLYAQEQASFRDRMFLTVAARTDQNSSFGTKFERVVYPKAQLSWVLSDESFFPRYDWLNQFRVRTAYGASGVQPGGTVSLQTFSALSANVAAVPGAVGGADTPGLVANALGNPDLKPERSAEFEGGFETSVFNNRGHIDFTYYSKNTHDALISQPIAPSSGASTLSVLKNLGSTFNNGVEVTLNATLIDRRALGWDMTIGGSHLINSKVVSIGTDPSGKPLPSIAGPSGTRDSVGLPINALFVRPYSFADTAGGANGIITPNEVTVATNAVGLNGFVFAGWTQPRDIVTITNGFDLLSRKLRITVFTDYKGGFSELNSTGQFMAQNFATWYSENVKSTPLWDQARSVVNSSNVPISTVAGYWESGQFWKLREISAALTLPNAVAQRIRAHDAQLVFSARNLHTWTNYTGVDPEENYGTGDVQTALLTTAPRTYFQLRANLHY